ncbi:DsbA family protein [Candidatus Falkowbacteria bacterium]|nr:DsbA family protein [Candidatus Falkowbacteria bacterium]
MKKSTIILGVIGLLLIGWFIYSGSTKVAYTLPAGERPFKGRGDASIVITEFSDFQCPACKAAQSLVRDLDSKYGANIKFEYKHFPLTSIHQYAYDAALAAECANDQGKFWEYHDLLFGYQPNLNDANLMKIATALELDTAQFEACLDNESRRDVVEGHLKEAQDLQLRGTPTFLYNGVVVEDRSQLENMIKKDLGL